MLDCRLNKLIGIRGVCNLIISLRNKCICLWNYIGCFDEGKI